MDEDNVNIGTPANKGSKQLPQEWYDDNRQSFNAETTVTEPKEVKCPHNGFFSRIRETNEVQCKQCGAGWFQFPIDIKDGFIV